AKADDGQYQREEGDRVVRRTLRQALADEVIGDVVVAQPRRTLPKAGKGDRPLWEEATGGSSRSLSPSAWGWSQDFSACSALRSQQLVGLTLSLVVIDSSV